MTTRVQMFRYAVVGLVSNLVLYGLYLFLTWLGLGHKTAMSLLYVVGVVQTFLFNRNWTFTHDGSPRRSFQRYVITYIIGYIVQWLSLALFVDKLAYPHQLVMAVLIVVTALLIFLLQKYWVFPNETVQNTDTSKTQNSVMDK